MSAVQLGQCAHPSSSKKTAVAFRQLACISEAWYPWCNKLKARAMQVYCFKRQQRQVMSEVRSFLRWVNISKQIVDPGRVTGSGAVSVGLVTGSIVSVMGCNAEGCIVVLFKSTRFNSLF